MSASNLAEWWQDHPDIAADRDIVTDGLRIAADAVVPDTGREDQDAIGLPAPEVFDAWLRTLFPSSVRHPFADRHIAFWEWVWEIKLGIRPRPFVGIWPRGGAKSSSAELAAAALGTRGQRRYVLYVRDTQDRADESVSNVGHLLESESVGKYYPAHNRRMVSKYGSSRGWRRNRLRTDGGFTIDAIGLDVAARGLKIEDQRPDAIIIDDVDGLHDTKQATRKKIETIKKSILPAGTPDVAVIFIQNLIIPNGVAAQLADGRADFLIDRIVSGPFVAIEGLRTEHRFDESLGRMRPFIIAGTPTWAGQGIAECESYILNFGLSSFLQECQHDVSEIEGALWKRSMFRRVDVAPAMKRIVVAVDPSGGGDEIGIGAAGRGFDGKLYVLRDATQAGRLGPNNWGRVTVTLYDDLKADCIAAERNYGGDMVESNITVAAPGRRVNVKMVTASRGKAIRAEPVAALYGSEEANYEDGLVIHVGMFPELETEMTTWRQGDPNSPNRMDWLVWAITELALEEQGVKPRMSVA